MALKNTSSQIKGLFSEEIVKSFLSEKKWKLISQRQKYNFGEIDLVFKKNNKILLVEVKTLHSDWMIFQRINQSQILKLKKNLNHLRNNQFQGNNVKAFICYVHFKNGLTWLDIDEI